MLEFATVIPLNGNMYYVLKKPLNLVFANDMTASSYYFLRTNYFIFSDIVTTK